MMSAAYAVNRMEWSGRRFVIIHGIERKIRLFLMIADPDVREHLPKWTTLYFSGVTNQDSGNPEPAFDVEGMALRVVEFDGAIRVEPILGLDIVPLPPQGYWTGTIHRPGAVYASGDIPSCAVRFDDHAEALRYATNGEPLWRGRAAPV